jgi:hypothetical protein
MPRRYARADRCERRFEVRRSMIAPEFVFAVLSLAAGALAFAGEPVKGPTAEGSSTQAAPERVNPARRLEAEIEDYPAPPAAAADDTAARIPEVVEEPAAPRGDAAPEPRPDSASGAIDPSQVQRVLGKSSTIVPLSALDPTQVTLLQQRLRERGLYLGRIDGIAGPQTRAAVQAFLRERFVFERRLLEQGQVTNELAELVGITPPPAPTPPRAP